jgi:xanthine dehydrogenase small subunit
MAPADHEGRPILQIGAATTWAELGAVLAPILPHVAHLIERVGNPQTRHVATIGGQVATASAIGDLLPFFLVLDTTVTVASATHSRELRLDAFLQDPTATLRGALLTAITVRLPVARGTVLVEKASRRRDADVATITAAAYIVVDGARVVHAAIAVGGAGPRAQRLTQAEETLVGASLGADVAERAARLAQTELTPWSDVRASAAHRRTLVDGLVRGMLMDTARIHAEGDQ